jgi:hypothetical protein
MLESTGIIQKKNLAGIESDITWPLQRYTLVLKSTVTQLHFKKRQLHGKASAKGLIKMLSSGGELTKNPLCQVKAWD